MADTPRKNAEERQRDARARMLRRHTGAHVDDGFWNEMSRSAQMVRPGVVNFCSHLDRRFRVLMIGFALFFLIFVGISEVYFGRAEVPFAQMMSDLRYVFAYDSFLTSTFEKGRTTFSTFEAFKAAQDDVRPGHLRFAAVALLFNPGIPLVMILLALLTPRRAPVRFDLNRGLIYTWRRGRLWWCLPKSLNVQTKKPPYLPENLAFRHDTAYGYVAMRLQDGSETPRTASVGAYPPTRIDHNEDIISLMVYLTQFPDSDAPEQIGRTGFRPFDIARALHHVSLRRIPSLDAPRVQAAVDKVLADG